MNAALLACSLWMGPSAQAQEPDDKPHLYVREMVAVAVRPGGLITDTVVEGRIPVLRVGGALNNMTFAGAGGRLAVSPAHMDIAGRVSFQLVDILPITVEAVHTRYWDGPFAPLPYDEMGGTTSLVRDALYDLGLGFGTGALTINLMPTFQIKVGPVVAFSGWTISFVQITQPDGVNTSYLFDPYRGMVAAWNDRLVEHTSAVLWEPLDGEDKALLRVGGVLRGKYSWKTPDYTLTAGPVAMWKPGVHNAVPTITALVTPYIKDFDFVGGLPYIAVVSTWETP